MFALHVFGSRWLVLLVCAASVGCDVASQGSATAPGASGFAGNAGTAGSFSVPPSSFGQGGGLTIAPPPPPIDTRDPVSAERMPPPVSGGTLLTLRDGERMLVADPDRDRVLLVNLRGMYIDAVLEFSPGAQPTRAVEDASGHGHVILRGSGELASVDLASGELTERRAVCGNPRGIAYDAARDALIVSCAEGRLVELPPGGGPTLRTSAVDVDVRDVVFAGDRLFATRFRSAELLDLDAAYHVAARRRLPITSGIVQPHLSPGLFDANVAWRAVSAPNGALLVVHQRALRDEVDVEAFPSDHGVPPPRNIMAGSENVGRTSAAIGLAPSRGRSGPYGGGRDGCGGIVHSAVTILRSDGSVVSSPQLAGVTLPVDVAVSAGDLVAVASAGPMDLGTNPGGLAFSVALYPYADLDVPKSQDGCSMPTLTAASDASVIAVAFNAAGTQLVIQNREPAELRIFDLSNLPFLENSRTLSLGGGSAFDTGHDLFHRDAGGGIACASCHPEGGEDNHVWKFSDVGMRRTQPLEVGLEGTAPFHWDGALPDMTALMAEVFTRRMAGMEQSAARTQALERFVFSLGAPSPLRDATEAAVVRGRALFESEVVGCAACHGGEKLSNGLTASIGKGPATQVPSLRAVAYRAPFMRDGCAATLRDRFDATCGGTAHGDVSSLSSSELDDLVAYLESL